MKLTYSPTKGLSRIVKLCFAGLMAKLGRHDSVMSVLLKNSHLFDHLTEEQFQSIKKSIKQASYRRGDIIFQQGDAADNFYLIKTGSIRIYVMSTQDHSEIVLARLEVGDYFGEQALLNEMPGTRSAGAKAIRDTVLYAIPHAVYSQILNPEIKTILEKIGNQQLFEMLDEQLELFISIKDSILKGAIGKTFHYSDGDIIFKVHEQSDRVYFIISGHIVIELPDDDETVRVTELSTGQLFGELGVLQNAKRLGTAKAKGEAVVLAFDAGAFKHLHDTSPELQQLVKAMENVYRVKHHGVVNIYHGSFLNMKSINAIYQFDRGHSVTSAKVIGKPIFTMSYSDAQGVETLHYRSGRVIRRELLINDHRILSVMSVGEWSELPDICDLLLNAKPITDDQKLLFKQQGLLSLSKPKIVSANEREKIMCFCMNVSKGCVYDAISTGLNNVADISQKTGAGSVCGSCRPDIVELLGLRAWATVNMIEVIPLHEDIRSFRFKLIDPLTTDYQSGQHIVIQALIQDQLINRTYTLTSIPKVDDFIEITVKREPKGYFSGWLFEHAEKNALIRVSEPKGIFTLGKDNNIPLIFFAGGIGVTPALAFARFISKTNHPRRLHIDYSARTQKDFILLDEWKAITSRHSNITVYFRSAEEQGFIEKKQVADLARDFQKAQFYICGPKAFQQAVTTYLSELNVAISRIKTEEFIHAGSGSVLNDTVEM